MTSSGHHRCCVFGRIAPLKVLVTERQSIVFVLHWLPPSGLFLLLGLLFECSCRDPGERYCRSYLTMRRMRPHSPGCTA